MADPPRTLVPSAKTVHRVPENISPARIPVNSAEHPRPLLPAAEERGRWRDFVGRALLASDRKRLAKARHVDQEGVSQLSPAHIPLEATEAFRRASSRLQHPVFRSELIRELADSRHVRNLALGARRAPEEVTEIARRVPLDRDGSEISELVGSLPRRSSRLAAHPDSKESRRVRRERERQERREERARKARGAVSCQSTNYSSGDANDVGTDTRQAAHNLRRAIRLPAPGGDGARNPVADEALRLAKAARQRRRERYQLRELAATAAGEARVAKCGNVALDNVSLMRGEDGHAHYAGLLSCGLVWLCPLCSGKITARRAEQLTLLMERHYALGGSALFGTLTVRHSARERLSGQRRFIGRGFSKLLAHRNIKSALQTLGITGHVRVSETTHGANGWHTHIHYTLLSDGELTSAEIAGLELLIAWTWQRINIQAGRAAPYVERQTLELCRTPADAAQYFVKWGLAQELTGWVNKSGAGRSPWDILRDYGATRDESDRKLWREWAKATKGMRFLTWSRGLKARYRIPETSDQQEAAKERPSAPKLLLNRQLWNTLRAFPGSREHLLECIERERVDSALDILCSLPAYLDGSQILSIMDTNVRRLLATDGAVTHDSGVNAWRATMLASPLLSGACIGDDAECEVCSP